MKKLITMVMACTFLVSALQGCFGTVFALEEQGEENLSDIWDTPEGSVYEQSGTDFAADSVVDWHQLYADEINNSYSFHVNTACKAQLIYLDDNDIPELVVHWDGEDNDHLFWIADNSVQNGLLEADQYAQGAGKGIFSGSSEMTGNAGGYFYGSWYLEKGGSIRLNFITGQYESNRLYQFQNGQLIPADYFEGLHGQYSVNQQSVSYDEYQSRLNAAFDSYAATCKSLDGIECSGTEALISYINGVPSASPDIDPVPAAANGQTSMPEETAPQSAATVNMHDLAEAYRAVLNSENVFIYYLDYMKDFYAIVFYDIDLDGIPELLYVKDEGLLDGMAGMHMLSFRVWTYKNGEAVDAGRIVNQEWNYCPFGPAGYHGHLYGAPGKICFREGIGDETIGYENTWYQLDASGHLVLTSGDNPDPSSMDNLLTLGVDSRSFEYSNDLDGYWGMTWSSAMAWLDNYGAQSQTEPETGASDDVW